MRARSLLIASTLLACAAPAAEEGGTNTDQDLDLAIVGGVVVDGTGQARYEADVGVRDGRIVEVGQDGIEPSRARVVLDAAGSVVSPGFIDNHAHIQTTIHEHPLAENFLRQGITTIIASLHSGDQPDPLDEYAEALDVAPNVGFFAGHTWTRKQVLGLENRAPTDEELETMRALVARSMDQGALGPVDE